MITKSFTVFLVFVLTALQYQLWFSDGGVLAIWQLKQTHAKLSAENNQLAAKNAVLLAEVRDLKSGTEAIEERAREQLGMIKEHEVFYHIINRSN